MSLKEEGGVLQPYSLSLACRSVFPGRRADLYITLFCLLVLWIMFSLFQAHIVRVSLEALADISAVLAAIFKGSI